MICAIIICALLQGGGPRECDRSQPPQIVDLPHIKSWSDCRDVFRAAHQGEIPVPANLRLVRFEFYTRQTEVAARP